MSQLETVIAARAKIADPKDWVKGALRNKKGCMCAWEALRESVGPGESLMKIGHLFRPLIPADRRNPASNFHPLIQFNDHKQTTHAEVLGLFDQVIEGLQR